MRNERNAFQQLMQQWNELHPFNAVTIVKVAGSARPERLRAALAKVHETLGISRLSSRNGSYELDGRPSEPLVEEMDGDDLTALAERATGELNRPFDQGPSFPVRLFVFPRAGHHYIGRTYQHWVGDEYSMSSLLCRVLAEYLDVRPPASGAIDRACPTFRRTFATFVGPHRWGAYAAQVVGEHLRFRRCYRPRFGDESDLRVRVRFPPLPDASLPRLRAAATRLGVTLNDIVLAALAEAIAANTPDRLADPRRRDLAVTSIVDVRPLRPERLMDKLGLYLSYFNVICPGDLGQFEPLLAAVRAQSARAKAETSHLKAAIEMQLAASLWPWIPPEQRIAYFSHRKPHVAAVTNIRVPEAWLSGELGEATCGWWRGVSAGPMSPLVALVTTAAGQLTLGVTSRASGYTPVAVEAIVARFTDRLAAL